jgi:hypothetical protein
LQELGKKRIIIRISGAFKIFSDNMLLNFFYEFVIISIFHRLSPESVAGHTSATRWAYIDHMLRMNENRIPRQVFLWTPDGKRKLERPKTTLRRTIMNELKPNNIKIQDLQSLASD